MTAKLDEPGPSGAVARSVGNLLGSVVSSIGGVTSNNADGDARDGNGDDIPDFNIDGEGGDGDILLGNPNLNESFQF